MESRMIRPTLAAALVSLGVLFGTSGGAAQSNQQPANDWMASVGDQPSDPGPLANDISPVLKPAQIRAAMRKVADWQSIRIANEPSQDWTFAPLYVGLLATSKTLHDPQYRNTVFNVAQHFNWQLGPRKAHADDQAIGQAYLDLYVQKRDPTRIRSMREQFDEIMQIPDDSDKPVWWWSDALFMAPPVWAKLSRVTGDERYCDYMNHEWGITSNLLWDPEEHLFSRDAKYLNKHEKNGKKIFWSRGNGWVMGGLVRVLEVLPTNDPRRPIYVEKLREMSAKVASIQGSDGLWRTGLLDAEEYPLPEVSGSAFFVYAISWGINHHILAAAEYRPVVEKGWSGMVSHIYKDGRLGCIQPVGEAPGAYKASASYVYGVGAFLLAGSEVEVLSRGKTDLHR